VAQRSIEILIGRLITDEAFRAAFLADPGRLLTTFAETGYELTAVERAAVIATRVDLWIELSRLLDSRLQKAAFTTSNDHDS
jgi:hypothetical protein